MKTIWKFDLDVRDQVSVEMPRGANVIAVGGQDTTGHSVQVWAEVNPDRVLEERQFEICGTGRAAPDGHNHNFRGTVITAGGALVWHVYERAA